MSRFGDDTLGLNREIQASLQTAASGRADIEGQMASLDEIIDGSNIVDAMRSDADYLSVQSQGAGLLGAPGRYISETAVGAYELTASAVKGTVTDIIPALLDETVKDLTKKIARGRGLPDEITDSIVELAAEKQGFKTLADYGRKRIEGRKGKEPSYFRDSDIWIKPEDLAGAVPSVVAGLSMIATSGAAAPIAVPVMAAGISVPAMQAADSLYGDYAEALSENPDLEYDPKVAAALGAVVALETIGTKTVGVDLPMMMAKKAFKQSVKEGAKASTRKTLAKRVLSELAAAGVDGIEEVGEEGLEALITILYQPEYDDLRESILSGDFDKSDFGKVWEVLSSVDFGKTFVIGSGSYGFTRPAAALRQRYDTRDIRAAERSRRAEEIALDVRRGDVADIPIGREPAGDIPAEDITPGEAEPAPVEPVTFADFDNDKFADRLVAESPDVVDGILKTENGRNRKSGRAKAIWGSVIPEGVTSNQEQRQRLFDRLKAARERAEAAAAAVPEADIAVGEEAIADLRREEDLLVEEMLAIESADPDFADRDDWQETSVRLAEIQDELQAAEDAAVEADPEFSTTAIPVDTRTLETEEGTQMGSMPGGMATQPSTGRRYYTKRYESREQTRNETVANRLYNAAGVRVPNTSLLVENGEIVGVASEIVPGVRPGDPADAQDGLVIDAWLANWDVVGAAGDNLLVDRDGNAVRIDQGGALTTRAQGAPKGEAFGDTVGEIETLPAMNEALSNSTPAQLRRGFDALESVSEQDIKQLVKANSTGDTASDNRLIATLIKRRRDLLSRRDQIIDAADAEFSTTAGDLELDALNAKGEEKFQRLSPDEEANLTDGQRQIAENARKRLGREVVFVKQTAGTMRNGFILNRDSDGTIYIVVPADTQGQIAKVAKARGISEREATEAYEMVLLQTLLHENYHLSEGLDGEALGEEQRSLRADVHTLLSQGARVRYNQRIQYLFGEFEAGNITEATLEREVRAELATDLVTMHQSGVEALFLDRGRLRNAMSRIRMLANRLGGSKDVRIANRIVRTMSRQGRTLASYPGSVDTIVSYSTTTPLPPRRPGYNAAAGYAGNDHVPAIAYRNATAEEIAEAHKKNTRDAFLSPVDAKELNAAIKKGDAIARISDDGTSGFVLKKTGIGWDVTGVFNVGDTSGAGRAAVIDAIALGGNTLDCYDGYLGILYTRFGFVPTHRMEFNKDFAPTNWDYKKYGEPDVVLMTFTGVTNDKQAIADLVGYYGDNYDKRQAAIETRGETVEEWPSESERTVRRDVQALRQEAGRSNDATSEIVRRVLIPEYSTVVGDRIESPVPYLDVVRVSQNPTPDGVLDLFVRYRAMTEFGKRPKKPTAKAVMAEMERIGLPADETIANYVAENYLEAAKVAPPATLVGAHDQFGPRGVVETELSRIFANSPSPTAEQLASATGAPSPRNPTKNRGLVCVRHKYKKRKDKTIDESCAEFIENVTRNMQAAGAKVVKTDDDNQIDSLIKDNEVVIYTGDGIPAVYIQPAFMDRNKVTRDYAEIKAATVEAVKSGLHNWYREFGMAFAEIAGPESIAEAALIFGVTSAQSPVEVNMADTLFIMRAAREHKRLGKPWTVEALTETFRGPVIGKTPKGKDKRAGVPRKNKYTKSGEMIGFFTNEAAETIADFYVNGTESSESSLKVRTYSGGIAESAQNNFYPYSVQDRHQAAMYGFMPGSLNDETGEFSNDKLFGTQYEYRFAAYLTQRLSMEPELQGLTPSMIQSAQWFYVKSGNTIYSDADVKENAGLLLSFERENTDVTVGTLPSALRFVSEELNALKAEIAMSPEPLAAGRMVPGFTSFKNGTTEYSAGQAEARRLSSIMGENAARISVMSKPNVQSPGLTAPTMDDSAKNEMMQNIISSVTESDGSVRLLNEMGIPHTPLTAVMSSDSGGRYDGMHLTPLLGSISDPAAARIIGAIVGLGTMQPRMASIQPSPNGQAVTMRVSLQDGTAMTDRVADRLQSSLASLASAGNEAITSVSPNNGFVEVTVIPSIGRVDGDAVASKFDSVATELMDAAKISVRAEAFRSEVEVTDQDGYAEVIGSSGLAAGDPQGLLRRVLGEIAVPTLAVLRSSGYSFNRQQFADGHGLDPDVVTVIPDAEFSTTMDIGIISNADRVALRDRESAATFDIANQSFGELAAEEVKWYASLDNDDRTLLRAWAGSWSSGGSFATEGLQGMLDVGRARFSGSFWTSMRIVGSYDSGSLNADSSILKRSAYDGHLLPNGFGDLGNLYLREISQGISDGIHRLFDTPSGIGITGLMDKWGEVFFTPDGEWAATEIKYGPISRLLGEDAAKSSYYESVILAKAPEWVDLDKDWSSSTYRTMDDGSTWMIIGKLDYKDTMNTTISSIVNAISNELGTGQSFNYGQRAAVASGITSKLMSLPESSGSSTVAAIKKVAPLYNRLLTTISRGPKIVGEVYRGHFITRGEFASRFKVGDRFRSGAPASTSVSLPSAVSFIEGNFAGAAGSIAFDRLNGMETADSPFPEHAPGGGYGPDVLPVMFVIDSKTARAMSPATVRGDLVASRKPAANIRNKAAIGYKSYELGREAEGFAADREASQLASLVEGQSDFGINNDYQTVISGQVSTLEKSGVLTPEVAEELRGVLSDAAKDSKMLGPTAHEEHEAIVMPNTVYEVVSIDEQSSVVRLKEIAVGENDIESVPIFAEFSTTIPAGQQAIEPEFSSSTTKSIEWRQGRQMDLRRTLQDRFIELDYLQRDIEEAYGNPLGIEEDAIAKVRAMPGEIAHKAKRFADRIAKPLARDIAAAGLTQAEMGEYCCAIHALDANRELRAMSSAAAGGTIDCGLSDAEANRIIDDMRKRTDIDVKQVDSLQRRVVGMGRQNLRMAMHAGLISRQQFNDMNAAYPNYVPMWNAFDKDAQSDMDGAEQFSVPAEIFRARTGRVANSLAGNDKFFADRLAAMADQRFRVIRKSANNTVLQRLINLSGKVGDSILEIYKPGIVPVRLKDGRIGAAPDNTWRDDPTIFRVMVDGNMVLLRIANPKLAKAMKGSTHDRNRNLLMRTVSTYSSIFRYFTTQFGNPDFTFTNPFRDVQTGAASVLGENKRLSTYKGGKARTLSTADRLRIVAKSGVNLAGSWATVFGAGTEASRRDYAKYRALGGRQGMYTAQDPAKSRKELLKAARAGQQGKISGVINAATLPITSFAKLWDHVNTMFDDGVRFAVYRQLVREGVHPEKAIETTRDLTVDFSRMGTAGPTVNALYLYSNATVQGTTKTVRLMKSKTGRAVIGAYFMAGIMSEIWNDDDEDKDKNLKSDWDEIPEYQRDADLHIRLPEGFGSDGTEAGYLKFPVAYGLDVPFVMGRRLVRMIKGKDTLGEGLTATISSAVSQFVPGGFGTVVDSTNAADASASVTRALLPDILDPIFNLATNKDWLNHSIYNEPFPSDPLPNRSQMGRDSTWWGWKEMSELLNTATGGNEVEPGLISIQPEIIPYILGQPFGGTAKTIERIHNLYADSMHRQYIETNYPGEAQDLLRDLDTQNIPVLRRFMTSSPQEYDSASAYYEYSKISREADAALKGYKKIGDYENAQRIMSEQAPGISVVEYDKRIREYKKEMRDIKDVMQSQGYSPEEIKVEMTRMKAVIQEAQRDMAIAYREEEQRAKAEAGTN
jgi:hypothetical protein